MTTYTNKNPAFSYSIPIVETSDPAHADNINASAKQLLQNDIAIKKEIGDSSIEEIGDGTVKGAISQLNEMINGVSFCVIDGKPYMTYDDSLVYEDGQLVREVSDADIDNAIDETFDDDPTNDALPDEAIDHIVDEIFNS